MKPRRTDAEAFEEALREIAARLDAVDWASRTSEASPAGTIGALKAITRLALRDRKHFKSAYLQSTTATPVTASLD